KAVELVTQSLDRLGVCNRLNLLLVDRRAAPLLRSVLPAVRGLGIEIRATDRAGRVATSDVEQLDVTIGHEWANDSERVSTVTLDVVEGVDEAVQIANDETSGLAAGVVAESEEAATTFLDGYRGTAAFWHATTRFTDGFALTGAPETGINVDSSPGPRGPVTYRDLWLRQYRVIGDGSQRR
ncbi:MAG: gamma-glutamyl phosphate reductase, partial [Gaiellales bacterium]